MLSDHQVRTEISIKEEAHFFTKTGTILATWGLGFILVFLQSVEPKQLSAIPMILAPIAIATLAFAIFSKNKQKREDSSHIHLLALAGTLSSISNLPTPIFFYGLSFSITIINLLNLNYKAEVTPIGSTTIFAVLLSPKDLDFFSTSTFIVMILICTIITGRREKLVALSIFPLGASLYLLFKIVDGFSLVTALLSIGHIITVYYLRRARALAHIDSTERRLYLDDVVTVFALSSLLYSTILIEAHYRYLTIAVFFTVTYAWHYVIPLVTKHYYRAMPHLLSLLQSLSIGDRYFKNNATLTTVVLSIILTSESWPIMLEPFYARSVRVFILVTIGVTLFVCGKRRVSFLQVDSSKLIVLYASMVAYRGITSTSEIQSATIGAKLILFLLQFSAIGLVTLISNRDLGIVRQGIWQGIFSSRTLVRVRRTRIRIIEFVFLLPMIGWMFRLGDNAVGKLQTAFGPLKTWTISHYAICISVSIGLFSTMSILQNFYDFQLPALGVNLPFGMDASKESDLFKLSVFHLSSTLIYTSVVFLVGAMLKLRYLRVISIFLAEFIIVFLWLPTIYNKKNITSGWFFPLTFCCIIALFRIFYRQEEPCVRKQIPQPGNKQ